MIPEHAQRLHWTAVFRHVLQALLYAGIAAYQVPQLTPYFMLVAVLIAVGIGIVKWSRFAFWTDDEGIKAVTGGLVKSLVEIPYDKIQAVNVTRTLLQRPLGLKRVSIKTAASGTQLEITSVQAEVADALEALLRSGRVEDVPSASTRSDSVRKLSTREILVAAGTSSHFLIILGGLGYVVQLLEFPFIDAIVLSWLPKSSDLSDFGVLGIIIASVVLIAVAYAVSFLFLVLAFRAFSISVAPIAEPTIRIQRGIGEIQQITIPVKRIQTLVFKQSPLQLLLGYGTLSVGVIGHSEENLRNTGVYPLISKRDLPEFCDTYFPGFTFMTDGAAFAPSRALPRFVLRASKAWIVVGPLAALFAVVFPPGLLMVVPFALYTGIVGFVNHRVESLTLGDEFAQFVEQGWNRTTVLVRRKVYQQLVVKQDFVQAHMQLSTFGVQVASGPKGSTHLIHDLESRDAERFTVWIRN